MITVSCLMENIPADQSNLARWYLQVRDGNPTLKPNEQLHTLFGCEFIWVITYSIMLEHKHAHVMLTCPLTPSKGRVSSSSPWIQRAGFPALLDDAAEANWGCHCRKLFSWDLHKRVLGLSKAKLLSRSLFLISRTLNLLLYSNKAERWVTRVPTSALSQHTE